MFWLHEEDLPPGVGIERFGAVHLAYIVFFLALAVCWAFVYKRLPARRRRAAERVLGLAVLFFGLCEYGVTALIGRFDRYTLPLHLCSLMFLLTALHALTNAARPGTFAAGLHGFLGAVVFHPGILGAWAALLFPDWLSYPFWNYLSLSGFMSHGLIAAYGAAVLVTIAEAPDPAGLFRRDLRSSLLFMVLGAAVMYGFDRLCGTNYWFMAAPGVDSPFAAVYERSGCGAYLLAYLLTAAAFTALWYALRRLLFVRGRGEQTEKRSEAQHGNADRTA